MSTTDHPGHADRRRRPRRADLRGPHRQPSSWPRMHIGERLGLYAALDEAGPSTSGELAARAGVDERYAREWLEQQAVAGVLSVDDPAASAAERRYAVPAEHREALLDRDSPLYVGAMPQLSVGMLAPIEQMIEAFRTGEGVPYADYGADTPARASRPSTGRCSSTSWPSRGSRRSPRSTRACARRRPPASPTSPAAPAGRACRSPRGYPAARVDGFDVDGPVDRGGPGPGGRARRGGPGALLRAGRERPGARGDLRPGHDLRGAPRHGAARRGPAHRARPAGRGRQRDRGRREGGRVVHRARRRAGAPELRLQRAPLPRRRPRGRALGRDRDGHPAPHRGRVRAGRRLRARSRSCRSSTTSGASTASPADRRPQEGSADASSSGASAAAGSGAGSRPRARAPARRRPRRCRPA